MKIALPIALVMIYIGGIFWANQTTPFEAFSGIANGWLAKQLTYQTLLLAIAGSSMLMTYLLNRKGFSLFFRKGNINAIGQPSKALGIKPADRWMKTGLSLTLVISLVTGSYLYFTFPSADTASKISTTVLLWIILVSLTNTFSEEVIFRLGINGPLAGRMSASYVYLISAVLFGLAHFWGAPGGLIGVLMAGFLGYVLSKSVQETQGLFWAWTIHFCQDVLIFGTVYLLS